MKALFLLFIVFACVTSAQTPDGISAPASRTLALTADEAAFTITVAGTLDSTQQQVKEACRVPDCPTQPWWLRVWARTAPCTRPALL